METNSLKIEFENGISIIPLTQEASTNGHIWHWNKEKLSLFPSINNIDYHVWIKNGVVTDCGSKTFYGQIKKIIECYKGKDKSLKYLEIIVSN